ncbi:hypothetical protein BC936DRAFT_144899 [Jimgerdemannia flammicorona]|uniref:Thioredoxin domain-containing protein n=1 Tax=Jimgerdemannia flammicorona TaxID=994334 RepID=A0A433DBE4_9FUNG|nr:hypothetical protein BC936DRAFT_144899 [Jimgerdemannia flammicorona]
MYHPKLTIEPTTSLSSSALPGTATANLFTPTFFSLCPSMPIQLTPPPFSTQPPRHFKVKGFPTIKFFPPELKEEKRTPACSPRSSLGPREAKAIIDYLLSMMPSNVPKIISSARRLSPLTTSWRPRTSRRRLVRRQRVLHRRHPEAGRVGKAPRRFHEGGQEEGPKHFPKSSITVDPTITEIISQSALTISPWSMCPDRPPNLAPGRPVNGRSATTSLTSLKRRAFDLGPGQSPFRFLWIDVSRADKIISKFDIPADFPRHGCSAPGQEDVQALHRRAGGTEPAEILEDIKGGRIGSWNFESRLGRRG